MTYNHNDPIHQIAMLIALETPLGQGKARRAYVHWMRINALRSAFGEAYVQALVARAAAKGGGDDK